MCPTQTACCVSATHQAGAVAWRSAACSASCESVSRRPAPPRRPAEACLGSQARPRCAGTKEGPLGALRRARPPGSGPLWS
eukprot:354622-Chlamydomonas_euryale.AAC.17